ncbi:MAG: hypothetical protein QXL94_00750 [Candidatus Parvarchaeum sp.]
MNPFSKLPSEEKGHFELEYFLRKELSMSTADIENSSFVKLKYFMKIFKDTQDKLEKEYASTLR